MRHLTRRVVFLASGLQAFAAHAQQPGDTVPESALSGPAYSLGRPAAPAAPVGRYAAQALQAYVYALQQRLPSHGYPAGRATGVLDPETERAILAYQRDAGLARDARSPAALKRTLDHITYARPAVFAEARPAPEAAPAAAGPSPPVAPPPSSAGAGPDEATIRLVQKRLHDKGYDVDVTGRLDVYTENAIKVFQAANDLPRDGRIDGYLLDLLKQ